MDILSRLMKFRDYTELSNSQFADKAGIPRPTLSQFLNGRNKRLSDELAAKLHTAYPQLNMMWLLFGEGDMLDESNIEISEGKIPQNRASSPHPLPENQEIRVETSLFGNDEFDEPIRKKPEPEPREAPKTANSGKKQPFEEMAGPIASALSNKNTDKAVKYVMVFYTDHSADVFFPS